MKARRAGREAKLVSTDLLTVQSDRISWLLNNETEKWKTN
jgi:hypothetical protein